MVDSKKVFLKVRDIYGAPKLYPGNENAELFCLLAKARSLTGAAVEVIQKLGFTVETDRHGFDPLTVVGIQKKD